MKHVLAWWSCGLLAALPVSAQQFGATAAGQLSASSSGVVQGWGPGVIPATPVSTTAQSLFGIARATASFSGTALDVALSAADNGYASVDIDLTLQAPVDAGVRVRLQPSQSAPLSGMSATALGQTHHPGSSGVIEFDALVPAGGLVVQVHASLSAMPFAYSAFACSTTWSYPGVVAAGSPTPGCLGGAVAWTRGIPRLGSATFGVTCANTHPFLGAVSAIGFGGLATPVPYDGVAVWLDPALPIVTRYLPGNASGDILDPLPLPSHASFLGLSLFSQFVVFEPNGCMPLDLSGSNAVRWTIQP